MFKKFINIIWVIMNIYLIISWSVNIYNRFMNGEPFIECVWRVVVVLAFTILTIVLVIKDIVPDFRRKKKRDNSNTK